MRRTLLCLRFGATGIRRALQKISTHSNAGNINASSAPTLSDLLSNEVGRGGLNDAGSHMMRQKLPGNEAFYFHEDSKSFCRLCQIEIKGTPKNHIYAPDKAIHSNHGCREIVLDSMALLARQGVDIREIQILWAEVFLQCPQFPRIHCLTHCGLTIQQRSVKVGQLLKLLRDAHVLDLALSPAAEGSDANTMESIRRRVGFEALECIGDNTWGSNMSTRMMLIFPDKQWLWSQSANSFNVMRDALEMNTNLEQAYDFMDLQSVLSPSVREKMGTGKIKADMLESILGELHKRMWEYEPQIYTQEPLLEVDGVGQIPLYHLIQHTISEMMDIIALIMLTELAVPAYPLALELAAHYLTLKPLPPVGKARGNPRRVAHSSTVQTFHLGVGRKLHAAPRVVPSRESHVPIFQRALPETTDERKKDVFADVKRVASSPRVSKLRQPPRTEPNFPGLVQSLRLHLEGSVIDLDSSYDDLYFRDPALKLAAIPSPLKATSSTGEWPSPIQPPDLSCTFIVTPTPAPPATSGTPSAQTKPTTSTNAGTTTTNQDTAAPSPPNLPPKPTGNIPLASFCNELQFLRVYPYLCAVREKEEESTGAADSENDSICPFVEFKDLAPGTKLPAHGVSLPKGIAVGCYPYLVTKSEWRELWGGAGFFGAASKPSSSVGSQAVPVSPGTATPSAKVATATS
jgi:hypothetical protein